MMRARTTAGVRGKAVAYQISAWISAFVMVISFAYSHTVLCCLSWGTGLGGQCINRSSKVLGTVHVVDNGAAAVRECSGRYVWRSGDQSRCEGARPVHVSRFSTMSLIVRAGR